MAAQVEVIYIIYISVIYHYIYNPNPNISQPLSDLALNLHSFIPSSEP